VNEWAFIGWLLAGLGLGLMIGGVRLWGGVIGLVGFVIVEVCDDGLNRRRR
jgi:hypothetical protein